MNIRRGTTPVINVSTGEHDWSHFQTVHMTFKDVFNKHVIVDKFMEDLTFSIDGEGNNIITCTLSQKDTLLFTPNRRVRLHLRGVDENGYAQGSEIAVMNVDDCLLNKVIDPDEDRKHGHETNPIYSCTVEVGTVENLPAGSTPYVRNDGTDRNAVFSFGLLRGAQGERGADGQPGQPGRDGVDGSDGSDGITPTVEITTIAGGHNVAFIYGEYDPRNTDTDIMDGAAGQPGQPGRDGSDGADGTDGVDGITPTVITTTISGGHNVEFSYGNDDPRNTNFDVLDGATGARGPAGPAGADGDSMFTVQTVPASYDSDTIYSDSVTPSGGNYAYYNGVSYYTDPNNNNATLDIADNRTYMLTLFDGSDIHEYTIAWEDTTDPTDPSMAQVLSWINTDADGTEIVMKYNVFASDEYTANIDFSASNWSDPNTWVGNIENILIRWEKTTPAKNYLETINSYDGAGTRFNALISSIAQTVVDNTVGTVLATSYPTSTP